MSLCCVGICVCMLYVVVLCCYGMLCVSWCYIIMACHAFRLWCYVAINGYIYLFLWCMIMKCYVYDVTMLCGHAVLWCFVMTLYVYAMLCDIVIMMCRYTMRHCVLRCRVVLPYYCCCYDVVWLSNVMCVCNVIKWKYNVMCCIMMHECWTVCVVAMALSWS